MKRTFFLKTIATIVVTMATPYTLLAKRIKYMVNKTGFFVGDGKDRNDKPISIFDGDIFTTKISTEDTDGGLYVFESIRIKEGGPTLHYHYDQDEWWYVLQGEFLIKVGETTYTAKAGDSVFGPRMVPHTFAKVGKEPGKLIISFQPAGKMEAFFKKVSEGALKNASQDEQDRFREAHGFKRVGPPIGKLKL